MAMNISSVNTQTYQNMYTTTKKQQSDVVDDFQEKSIDNKAKVITPEEKLQMANQFWAEHDAEYAKSQGEILQRIGEGMAVAQEISRRMSSGAKVSQSDENNLMQYDMRMYMAAKNAQMMAQRKEDMSDESLIDKYVEKHKNDKKDFVSEELAKVEEMGQYTVIETNASGSSTTGVSVAATSTIDISV